MADKTVIQWYGVGSAFVDAGLPMYFALECKPDNGGKIQNLADIPLEIMLWLKIVKSVAKEKTLVAPTIASADADANANANTNVGGEGNWVFLELMEPWQKSGHLIKGDV